MIRFHQAFCFLLLLAGAALADEPQNTADSGVRLTEPTIQTWRFGVIVTAASGPAANIIAVAPIPKDWPEQQVRIVSEDLDATVRRVRFRSLGNGARQMVVEIPRLAQGQTAQAVLTIEITKYAIEEPRDPSVLERTKRISKLREYLGASPSIETNDRKIKTLAKQFSSEGPAWEQVGAIFDWVRENIEYRQGPLKGAAAALRDGYGDCEELTSLFIALCRANHIPARTVWVPGHCYPEFHLTDQQGQGHWIPCQAAGAARDFGRMPETRPILQKGDNFRSPEQRKRVRYASATLKSANRGGLAAPTLQVIQQPVRKK